MSLGISVNGENISEESILEEMQYHPADKLPRQAAADALVIRCLLLQEAKHLQIEAKSREIGPGRFEVHDEAQIRTLLESKISVPEPDASACKSYYESNQQRFRSPDIYEPRHILYAADPQDSSAVESALSRAHAAIELLSREPDRFSEIASSESDCSSRSTGGHLGQVTVGDTVPEFEGAILDLGDDELCSEPIQTRYGVHVVRMEHHEKGRQLMFESVHQQISTYLVQREWHQAVQAFVRTLMERSTIVGWEPSQHKN